VFLAGLVNSVQGYACSSNADCQYPGCFDYSCIGDEINSNCNNRHWDAICSSTGPTPPSNPPPDGICGVWKPNWDWVTYTEPPPCNTSSTGPCICNAGSTGENGRPCTECVAGKYKIASGDDACSNCSAGQDSEAVGTTSDVCLVCPTTSNALEASDEEVDCTCNAGSSGPNGGVRRDSCVCDMPHSYVA